MKRSALVILVGLAALAAVASASSRAPAVAVPQAVKSPAKELGPLLAVVPGASGPVLGLADKRAIWVARRSPKLRLHNAGRAWAYAPDGSAIALATQADLTQAAAKVQFIDPRLLHRLAVAPLPWGDVYALAWGNDRVNVVLHDWDTGESEVVGDDAMTHRVSA